MASTGAAGQCTVHTNPHDTLTTSSGFSSLDQDETDKVRTYLRDLSTPWLSRRADETPREFPLSVASWCELRIDPFVESFREQYKIKIAYDASRSVLAVFPMPGRIHNALQQWLYDIATRHRATFSDGVRSECVVEFNSIDFTSIDEYTTSEKEPDLSIGWKADDQDGVPFKTHTVVEIGVSQTDQSLCEVRDLYLMGTQNIQRVILVRVEETPKFSSAKLKDIDIQRWENKPNAYTTTSDIGPVYCQNVQCVGALKIVWEVWERSPITKQVVKVFSKQIIPIPKNRQFELPLFEIPTQMPTGIVSATIKDTDIQDLASNYLELAVRRQASDRIKRFQADEIKAGQKKLELSTQKDEAQKKRDMANSERIERSKK
ncbi:hypothetical protein LTS15_010550 [Exophiala xenobiotica]|nr:hypothetical protein LTS15_010550 [Exophiala xenobiotica]